MRACEPVPIPFDIGGITRYGIRRSGGKPLSRRFPNVQGQQREDDEADTGHHPYVYSHAYIHPVFHLVHDKFSFFALIL